MNSLVGADNVWALGAIAVAWVAFVLWLEVRFRWVARISGPVLVMVGAAALSNSGVLPMACPLWDVMTGYIAPTCIPLLLFRADVGAIARKTGSMFFVFHLSAFGTIVGAILAVFLLGDRVPHAPELAGIMTGSYIGGSVNFVALVSTLDPGKEWPQLTGSLMVADNLIMAVAFFVLFAYPSMRCVRRFYPTPHEDAAEKERIAGAGAGAVPGLPQQLAPRPIALGDIATAVAIAVGIAAAGNLLAGVAGRSSLPAGIKFLLNQPYLLITAISVALATLLRRQFQRVAGVEELGTYAIYIFFFAMGVPADVATTFREVPVLFVFCGIMAAANIVVTLVLGKLFRRNLEELALGSNATLGGAPSAAAMTVSKGWQDLVLPGILVGVWGYVIGTYIGLAVTWILRAILA